MIDWGSGYASSWRVFKLDPDLWSETGVVARVDSVDVNRTRDGMMESGTISATREVGEGFDAGYYRVVMTAEQEGAVERVDVATLYCETTGGDAERGAEALEITGRSVLYPAYARRLLAGSYAPKGCDGARFAAAMLAECVAAPVSVEGSFELGTHVVFDLGARVLEAVWDVLDAGDFCIQVDGSGVIHVTARPSTPALDLSHANANMVAPGVSRDFDLSEVPNRYIADDGGLTAVAVNDDLASRVSTVRRGFYVDEIDSSPKPLAGETLPDYARRKLREASTADYSVSYTREYWPGVLPWSLVSASLPDEGLDGVMRVTRQRVACGHGVSVTEEASREVALWEG